MISSQDVNMLKEMASEAKAAMQGKPRRSPAVRSFAHTLRAMRANRDRAKLGAKFRISAKVWQAYETGRRTPHLEHLLRIAGALSTTIVISPNEILFGDVRITNDKGQIIKPR